MKSICGFASTDGSIDDKKVASVPAIFTASKYFLSLLFPPPPHPQPLSLVLTQVFSSTHSDGKLSVDELLEKAHRDGLKIYSLTDHDNMAGNL
jgi:hypothetical protein